MVGFLLGIAFLLSALSESLAFEGRIVAVQSRAGNVQHFLYSVSTNTLRVERSETNWPHPWNLIALDTGVITLVFPNNRTFMRLPPIATELSVGFPAAPQMPPPSAIPSAPGMPSQLSMGPTNLPGVSTPALPEMPAIPVPSASMSAMPVGPSMPQMPPMPQVPAGMGTPPMPAMPLPGVRLELNPTGEKTNLLGFVCGKFELKERGVAMEIWATERLVPFQNWLQNPPGRFVPPVIEERWGDLLRAKKLFPLLAVLRSETGGKIMRFEVKQITPEPIRDAAVFQPPAEYRQLQPMSF